MIPRIIVAQSVHHQQWDAPLGSLLLISGTSVTNLGTRTFVNLLAIRQTAIRIPEHASTAPPIEKHHDPQSPAFRQIVTESHNHSKYANVTNGICYYGPELLLWNHDGIGLMTFLAASGAAKQTIKALPEPQSKHLLRKRALCFRTRPVNGVGFTFYAPHFEETDLTWTRNTELTDQAIAEFLNPEPSPDRATIALARQVADDLKRYREPQQREAAARTVERYIDRARKQ